MSTRIRGVCLLPIYGAVYTGVVPQGTGDAGSRSPAPRPPLYSIKVLKTLYNTKYFLLHLQKLTRYVFNFCRKFLVHVENFISEASVDLETCGRRKGGLSSRLYMGESGDRLAHHLFKEHGVQAFVLAWYLLFYVGIGAVVLSKLYENNLFCVMYVFLFGCILRIVPLMYSFPQVNGTPDHRSYRHVL